MADYFYPLYDQSFSAEEQTAHSKAVGAHMPPQDMGRLGIFIFCTIPAADREDFLRDALKIIPPPALPGVAKALAAAVPAPDWQAAVRNIPELRGLA